MAGPVEITGSVSQRRYADFVAAGQAAALCLDFDGVLAPIVDEPSEAFIHPEAPGLIEDLAGRLQRVAIITGRPVRQAVALGGLDDVGAKLLAHDRDLLVLGQYGNERWSASAARVVSPRPPRGLASLLRELPGELKRAGWPEAHVEDKGLSVAVHTRRLADPEKAQQELEPALRRAASRRGLVLEPGRHVVEMRAPGMDKGSAVRALQRSLHADAMMFIGDDLGDIEAFEAISDLRSGGMIGFLVCSGSEEQQALVDRSDLVVDGPDGVMAFLAQLRDDLEAVTS